MSYSIGELSKKFNIAPSTLRYYEKEGLLSQVKRKASGVREFDEEDCRTLLLVDCLKQSGMSIREISQFSELMRCGDRTLSERNATLQTVTETVKENLKRQKQNLKRLRYEAWLYEKACQYGSMEKAKNLPLSAMPKKIRKVKQELDELLED